MSFISDALLILARRKLRKPLRCQQTTVSGVTMMRDCFQADKTRRAVTQKTSSKRPRLGRGMSTLQRDELLTQSKILEKEILPPTKEVYQHSEEEPDKAKHDQDL